MHAVIHARWNSTPTGGRRRKAPGRRRLVPGRALTTPAAASGRGVMAEVHKQATPVVAVLLHPVVQLLDLALVEEAQHLLLQCAAALARDDLDHGGLFLDG